jgi:cytidyltransferase-like protein
VILRPKDFPLVRNFPRRIGVTSGCFDLLHFYHLQFLERCREHCDFLIVGVDSDRLIQAAKGHEPAIPESQRLAMVEALHCVNAVWLMRDTDELYFLLCSAHLYFRKSAHFDNGTPVGCPANAKLIIIPDIGEATSSGAIKEKIKHSMKPQREETPKMKP